MGRPKKEVSEENIERFQKELEEAGDKLDVLLKDKKGRSRSCLLCRRRKQRCDHKLPSCTACLKAAVKCVQPARYASPQSPQESGSAESSKPSSTKGSKPKKVKKTVVKQDQQQHEYVSKLQNLIHGQNQYSTQMNNIHSNSNGGNAMSPPQMSPPNHMSPISGHMSPHNPNNGMSIYQNNNNNNLLPQHQHNNQTAFNNDHNNINTNTNNTNNIQHLANNNTNSMIGYPHTMQQQAIYPHRNSNVNIPNMNTSGNISNERHGSYSQSPSATSPMPGANNFTPMFQYNFQNQNSNHAPKSNMLQKQKSLPPIPTPLLKQESNSHFMSHSPSDQSIDSTEMSRVNSSTSDSKVIKKKNASKSKRKQDNSDKDDYTIFLEKKLKYLEKLIDLQPGSPAYVRKANQYKKICHLLGEIGDLKDVEQLLKNKQEEKSQQNNHSNLTTPGPVATTPNSSILPLPPVQNNHNNVYPLRSPYVSAGTPMENANNPNQIPALSSDSLDSVDFSKCIFAKYNLKEFLSYDPAFEFDEQLSRSFLDTFFTRLQFKYPLLDEEEIYAFHENYLQNQIYSYSETEFHFACGRMWMVFTISACLHMTTGKYKGQPPVRYFSTAIRHITRCGDKLTPVQELELSTLLVLYIVRTDTDSMLLYDIINDVMNICKNKLHLHKWHSEDPFANKKLRLFWCVYLLERMICVAVGKPYTIHENEIDVPLFDENSFFTHSKLNSTAPRRSGVHFINQSLKLRRIESHFVEKLKILPATERKSNHTREELEKQLPLVKKVFHELELWRAGCSSAELRNFENETLKLYYYRSVRLLIQPFLEVLRPEDRLFRECQASAGQICQLYKTFHQKTVTGHSTPAVHTVFVAGVTLIYCMWLARNYDDEKRRKLGDISKHTRPLVSASLFSTMDDLRACSVCLYVMTERSRFAKIFRDTFDQLMNATVGNLIERCGPDSAELIYMKQNKKKSHSQQMTIKNGGNNTKSNESTIEKLGDKIGAKNKTDFEDDSSSISSDVAISKEGMPPAVDRTFGKRQASEHVGFVENSQVDLDNAEKEKLKMQKGVLEKTTVPKGLSHLLIEENEQLMEERKSESKQMDVDSKPVETPEYEDKKRSTSNGNIHSSGNNGRDESKDSSGTSSPNVNEYIVQKPINATSFDWNLFKQQAFLQQHLAQQNLQAYLSTLKHDTDQLDEQGNVSSKGPVDFPTQMDYHDANGGVQDFTDNKVESDIARSPGHNNKAASPSMNQESLSENASAKKDQHDMQISSSVNQHSPLQSVMNAHTPIPSLSQMGCVTSGNSNQQIGVGNSSNGGSNYNGNQQSVGSNKTNGMILFSNGTHDMINNISTWTNDSVLEFMNTEDDRSKNGSDLLNSQQALSTINIPNSQGNINNSIGNGVRNNNNGQTISRTGTPAWALANGHMSGITFSSATETRNDGNNSAENGGSNNNDNGYNMSIFQAMGNNYFPGNGNVVDSDANNDGTEIYSEMLF